MTANYGHPASILDSHHAASPLSVERILCISNGELGPSQKWYIASQLPTAHLEPRTEVMRRVTVTQDPKGKQYRDRYLRTIKVLASIDARDLPLPSRLSPLKSGYKFDWVSSAPHCNVKATSGGLRATLIYAGEEVQEDDLARLHDRAIATVSNSDYKDFVCLLYREGNEIKCYEPLRIRSVTAPKPYDTKDITEPIA